MSFFFGTKSQQIGKELSDYNCQKCEGKLFLNLYSKYIHFFQLFKFPFGRYIISICNSCEECYRFNHYTLDGRFQLDYLKKRFKRPLSHFSGFVLFPFFIVLFLLMNEVDKRLYAEYFEEPELQDVYEFKTEDNNYSTFRIIEISNDSIFINENQYIVFDSESLSNIESSSHYFDYKLHISQLELDSLRLNNRILRINRKGHLQAKLRWIKDKVFN